VDSANLAVEYLQPMATGWQQVQGIPTPPLQNGYYQKPLNAAKAVVDAKTEAINQLVKMTEQNQLSKETLIDILANSGYLNKNVT